MSDPFEQGTICAMNGGDVADCPYEFSFALQCTDELREAWMDGFDEGARQLNIECFVNLYKDKMGFKPRIDISSWSEKKLSHEIRKLAAMPIMED